jgi:hypothetical protein
MIFFEIEVTPGGSSVASNVGLPGLEKMFAC